MLEQARPAASKVPAALAVGRGLELEGVYIYRYIITVTLWMYCGRLGSVTVYRTAGADTPCERDAVRIGGRLPGRRRRCALRAGRPRRGAAAAPTVVAQYRLVFLPGSYFKIYSTCREAKETHMMVNSHSQKAG